MVAHFAIFRDRSHPASLQRRCVIAFATRLFVLPTRIWRAAITLLLGISVGVSAQAQDNLTKFKYAQDSAEAGGWTRARVVFEEIAQEDRTLPEAAWNAAFLASKTQMWEACTLYYRFYLHRVPEASDKAETEDALAYCSQKIPERGTIDVRATPKEAVIFIDGLPLGEGSLHDLALSSGAHNLRIELRGYDTVERTIEVLQGVKTDFPVTLKETIYHGTLALTVDQEAAFVRIDGRLIGQTPLPEDGVQERAKKKVLLTVEKDGYKTWQRYITLQPDSTYELDINMLRDFD